ncbi:MAG TPA: hypothetical protein VFB52_07370 [Solirubrobacterales bacterium]|nr:hypothetical protein [Solirubrobacterales bacterium]
MGAESTVFEPVVTTTGVEFVNVCLVGGGVGGDDGVPDGEPDGPGVGVPDGPGVGGPFGAGDVRTLPGDDRMSLGDGRMPLGDDRMSLGDAMIVACPSELMPAVEGLVTSSFAVHAR